MGALLFYTIFVVFIGSLVGLGKLGETLSKNPSIRQFCNSRSGVVTFSFLIAISFLTAMAGAPASRMDLILGGMLSLTFFFSIAVFSEESSRSRRARTTS